MDYITASDLAAIWRIPLAEVYRRANRGRWRRTKTRPVGYLMEDVRRATAQRA